MVVMFIITDKGYRINLDFVSCWYIHNRTIYFDVNESPYLKTFETSSDAELFAEYLDSLQTIEDDYEEEEVDAITYLINTFRPNEN